MNDHSIFLLKLHCSKYRLEMQKASSTKFIGATAAKLGAPSVKEMNKEIDCYLF